MEKRYQVFVSSTYADLMEERQNVIRTLMEMDCIPAGMELFPAADEEQWAFIKKIIDDCDYYILIIGGRYGSVTNDGISYTEKEYDYAMKNELPVLAFIHESPGEIVVEKSDTDPTLKKNLDEFRSKVAAGRLVKLWKKASDLPGLVALSLIKNIKTYPGIGWVRANQTASDDALSDLNILRKENQDLKAKYAELVDARTNEAQLESLDLAALDDDFEIHVKWKEGKEYSVTGTKKITTPENISLSWGEIFSCIAPDLETNPSDEHVKILLGLALYRRRGLRSDGSGEVDYDDFQTIRVQLTALGLVQTRYSQTTKGGMSLFWSLTRKGVNEMISRRTIKRS